MVSSVFLSAQATAASSITNLPVHHWSYEALSRLARVGLISSSFLSIQPIRRDEAARLVAEALANHHRLKKEPSGGFNWTDELLRRLEREFRAELQTDRKSPFLRGRPVDTLEIGIIWADLDDRPSRRLENSGGRSVSEGANARLSWRAWAQAWDRLAVTAAVEGDIRDHNADLELIEASLKLDLGILDLEAGRERQWWGPGEHGALLLSDNAPPMDLYRIGNAHPSRLPWFLDRLGDWKWSLFVSRLEFKRDVSRAKFAGLRIAWAPMSWLEIGGSRTVLFGGRGRPHLTSLKDFAQVLVGFGQDDLDNPLVDNNNLGAWDVTVYLPFVRNFIPSIHGAKLYLEYGGEDNLKNEFLGIEYRGLGAIAQLMGLSLSLKRADLNLEYSNTVDDEHVWYEHFSYTSGYRYRDYTIGHEVGGDADDLSVNGRFYLRPDVHLLTGLERERVGLDRNHSNRRVTYAGHLGLVYSVLPEWEASVVYRYEQIDRPRFIKGEGINSHLITMLIAFHLLP